MIFMLIRNPNNPLISREDIPDIIPFFSNISSVFNPAAVMFNDEFVLLLRVQSRGRETFLIKATSEDGVSFTISKKLILFEGIESITDVIYHIYDPRLTKIDNTYYIVFAIDTDSGCKLGLASTSDFEKYHFHSLISNEESRNGVLFPEKINNKYYLLHRPNKLMLNGGVISGQSIILSESSDLVSWQNVGEVFSGRPHYWDELIGSGPPPIKTRKGWLHIYHGVATHFSSINVYQAGVVLLDLQNPAKVLARSRNNILEPREMFELTGQVPNVVFPSGIIVDEYDSKGYASDKSKVIIYYGAADSSVCSAGTTIHDLINSAIND